MLSPIYLILAWVFVGVGLLGVFLPVLPTTPFLILAAFLFSKSSPRFHQWLRDHRLLGPSLKDWEDRRVIRPKAKVLASLLILMSADYVLIYKIDQIEIQSFVAGVMLAVLIFILSRKSR